eukprot:231561_1
MSLATVFIHCKCQHQKYYHWKYMFLFGVNDAIYKLSGASESQVLLPRFITQLGIAFVWWKLRKDKEKHEHWYGDAPYTWIIWTRGMFCCFQIILTWYSIPQLPLGDFMCIFYQSPLWIVFAARVILKEKLPKFHITASSTIGSNWHFISITTRICVENVQFFKS